jgi:hypothetical protein
MVDNDIHHNPLVVGGLTPKILEPHIIKMKEHQIMQTYLNALPELG